MNKGAFSSYIAFGEWEQQGKATTPIFPTQAAKNRLDPVFWNFSPCQRGEGARTPGGKKFPNRAAVGIAKKRAEKINWEENNIS